VAFSRPDMVNFTLEPGICGLMGQHAMECSEQGAKPETQVSSDSNALTV